MSKKLKILFLPRWYPHRYDPMPGLFIQKQAEVISSFSEVSVLYVHEDPGCPDKFEIDIAEENNVRVVRVYYKIPLVGLKPLNRWIKSYRFMKAYFLGFRMLRDFKPHLVHVHVLTRQGFVALLYRIFTRTPYVITEHWSRYLPQNGTYKGFLRKWVSACVLKYASAAIAVSENLKRAMISSGIHHRSFYVIGNPVDMEWFRILENERKMDNVKKRIIHISCFEDKSKNISGFLRIISRLVKNGLDFECRLIGDGPDWALLKNYSVEIGLSPGIVSFTGLKEQDVLVKEINNADFLVLSSHYETFGSVIIESLACGIPVVTFDVGIASEVINITNGLIVGHDDESALEKAITIMLDRCRDYDRSEIRKSVVEKYNCKVISDQLCQVYSKSVPAKKIN